MKINIELINFELFLNFVLTKLEATKNYVFRRLERLMHVMNSK